MKNLWSDADVKEAVGRWGPNPDLAETVYMTRLLGSEKGLVLHGGGNTSVKTRVRDAMGDEVDALCVKGSGRDMGLMTPEGMTALRLDSLRRLADLESLDDARLVSLQRAAKLDAAQPEPSVEMLLHAFLPARFIAHTHANAVLALTNQSNWEAVCREAFGDRVAITPYAMSGFAAAIAAKSAIDMEPDAEALLILRHGLFTFGSSAKEAYLRMIRLVSQAEALIMRSGRKTFSPAALPADIATLADVAPVVRGATAIVVDAMEGDFHPFILDFRTSPAILNHVNGAEAARYATKGPGTPDFVIRTRPWAMLAPAPAAGRLDEFMAGIRKAVAEYAERYHAWFARNDQRAGGGKRELDPLPRVVLVPGLGLFGLGRNKREATIAADLAEADVDIVAAAESLGQFQPAAEEDLFDIEYWGLERAKLAERPALPLEGRVTLVTGGASGIGLAVAEVFAEAGSAVVVVDLDGQAAEKAAAGLGGLGVACDVTDGDSLNRAVEAAAEAFGGIDIVVSNAGAAWQGRIGEVDEALLRKSFELNFWSHQRLSAAAVRVMTAQGMGGCLLYNTSKQALNPGKNFGPYGLPKAATLFLMKQYALDHGRDGIRTAAVNADRIRSGLLTPEMIESRSKARGVSPREYMAGNLLGREVTARDVAMSFLHLALSPKTTAATITVDGGNIEASLR